MTWTFQNVNGFFNPKEEKLNTDHHNEPLVPIWYDITFKVELLADVLQHIS
jgi:hypothetical protein